MPNFFYIDANGQKQGLFTAQQLQALATQGIISPQTPLETDTGHKGTAGQIPGLQFNTTAPPPFVQPAQVAPAPPSATTFFYYDASGQRHGAVSDQQLKMLASQGIITPNTPLEASSGHRGTAGQIPGLFASPAPVSSFPMQQVGQPQPYASAQIVIHQPDSLGWGLYMSYELFVNGQKAGTSTNRQQTAKFSVPVGQIQLRLPGVVADLAAPVIVDVAAGQEKKFILRRKKYVSLKTVLFTFYPIFFHTYTLEEEEV